MREMLGGCCVCSDERGWDENPLVYCDGQGCSVAVHQACYGIVTVPTGPWFCRKCESQERAARVKCELCPRKDGALKRTDSGGWCHVVCALFIPEAWFGNVQTMEPIILKGVPADRYNKVCYICEEEGKAALSTSGACMQCNKTGCKQHFHVTCAQTKGLLCEEAGNSANDVKYCGYCNQHSRKKKRDATCKPLPAFKPVATDSTDPVPEKISPSGRQDKNKTRPGANVGQNSSSQKGMGLSSTASKAESKERSLSRSSSLSSSSDHSSAVTSRTVSTGPSSSTSSTPSTSIAGAAAAHSTSAASKPTTGGGKFTTANFVETTIQASPANFNNNAASSKSLKSETSPSSFFTSSPSKLDISGIVSMDTKPGIKTLDTAGKTTATSADRSLADTDASVLTLSDSKRTSESERSTVKSTDTNSSKNSSSDSKLNKKSDDSKYKKTVGQSVPDIQASVRSVEESKRNNEYNFDRSDSPPILTSITSMPISSKSRGKKEQTAVDSKTVSEEGREITVTGRASTGSKRPLNKNEENGTTEQRKVKKPRGEKSGPRGKGVAKETSAGSAGLRSPKEGPSKGHKPYNQTPAGSSNSFSEQDSSHRFGFLSKDGNGLLGPSVPSMSSLFAASQASGSEAGSQFPTTMEQLLERQWVQGSQFLMEQGQHFNIASLLSCLYQLRQENQRLEEHITSLTSRRDQLLAVNARLSVPFGSQAPSTSSSAVPSSTSLSNTSPLRNHTPRTNEEPFSAGRSFITGLAGSLSAGSVPGLASLTMAGSDERNAIAGLVGIGGGDRNAVLGLVGSDGRNSVGGASYLSPALNKNNRVNHGAPHDVNMSARDGSGRSPAGSGGSVNTSTPGPLSSPLMDGHPPSVTMAPPHIRPPHATAVDQFLGTHILTAGLSSPRGRGGGQLLSPSRRRTASAGYSGDPTPPGPVMSHPLIASAMAGQPFTMSAVGPQLSGSRLHESLLVPAAAVSIAEQLHRQQQQKGLLDVDKSPSLLYQLQQQHQSQLLSTGLTAAQLLPSAEKLMQQTHQALNNSLPGLAGSDKLHLSALPGGGVMNSQLVRMGNDIEFSRTVNKNNSAKQARANNDK